MKTRICCAILLFFAVLIILSSFFGYAEYVHGGSGFQIAKQTVLGFTCGMIIDIGLFFGACYLIYEYKKKPKA